MTNHAPTSTNRRAYLLHCTRISLMKRWIWLAISALLGFTLAFILNLNAVLMLVLSVTVPLLVALLIAVDSWRRHSNDP